MKSDKPNLQRIPLQNVPIRGDNAKRLRDAILDEKQIFLDVDWKDLERRVLAALLKDIE